jgi:glycyl-tRNA synthetase alpha chain
LLPAFDLCLKCSHLFNLLDARGAISVTERVGVIARIRQLAVASAKSWVDQQRTA